MVLRDFRIVVASDEMGFCFPAFDTVFKLADRGERGIQVGGRILEFLFERIAIEYEFIRLRQ